ncbi:MAG: hypothetical protein ABIJ45_06540 [Candidatus Zixiibacteriota bacterium]
MNRADKIIPILRPIPVIVRTMNGPNKKGYQLTKIDRAVCPECGIEMIRLGTCFSCPVCGLGSCG